MRPKKYPYKQKPLFPSTKRVEKAISELEGLTTLSLNWRIFKFVQMSTGPIFTYPLSPSSHSKGSIGYNLSFKLGGGKF